MTDYDFSSLNDKDFEIFCADLLGEVFNRRFERFKAGKDRGKDGRFFWATGGEVILQCKHWPASTITALISKLKKDELPKVLKLKPARYLLAVSHKLSETDKNKLLSIFSPYIQSASDIYGREDLNDLLATNKQIERRHYKLWLSSTNLISNILNKSIYDRSKFALDEIIGTSKIYVYTLNHTRALDILEKHKVLIVSGEPGIGKTTLADQLCLHYVRREYELVHVAESIEEAERVFESTSKQVIYFDDFLGRNYLDALSGHEGSRIVPFIRRIRKSSGKRLILTSRSTILNRGRMLIDALDHSNIKANEYLLQIASLSEIDRAWILYNHIWFSELDQRLVEEIYREKRYRTIVRHRNFNPRLIRFITDQERLADTQASGYWAHITQSLENPSEVWEHSFCAQHDDYGRAAVLLVTLNRRPIDEAVLGIAFQRYITLATTLKGSNDFIGTIRQLVGSLLNRHISTKTAPTIDLFNPSIGDYVLRRYARDVTAVVHAALALRSTQALRTLKNLTDEKLLSKDDYFSIVQRCLTLAKKEGFSSFDSDFLTHLTWRVASRLRKEVTTPREIVDAISYFIDNTPPNDVSSLTNVYCWALDRKRIDPSILINFVRDVADDSRGDDELQSLSELLEKLDGLTSGVNAVRRQLTKAIVDFVSDNVGNIVNETDTFSGVDYGDYYDARKKVEESVGEALSSYTGIEFSASDIDEILDMYDVEEELNSYFENHSIDDDDRRISTSPTTPDMQNMDDIFDRG